MTYNVFGGTLNPTLLSGWSTGSGFDLIGPSFQAPLYLRTFRKNRPRYDL